MTVKGERVAVIGATQVLDAKPDVRLVRPRPTMPAWPARTTCRGSLQAVRAARATSDIVVVYLHWGHELAACPTVGAARPSPSSWSTPAPTSWSASHAHVQLGPGRLGSGYVDYGLGNFVFYAYGSSARDPLRACCC